MELLSLIIGVRLADGKIAFVGCKSEVVVVEVDVACASAGVEELNTLVSHDSSIIAKVAIATGNWLVLSLSLLLVLVLLVVVVDDEVKATSSKAVPFPSPAKLLVGVVSVEEDGDPLKLSAR